MRILGVDPGATGAAALFDHTRTSESGLRWIVIDLPRSEGGLDVKQFRDWLRKFAPEHAFIEAVTPNPKWGIYSSVRLVGSYKELSATLRCCDVPTVPITPPTWKRAFHLLKTDKEAARQLALKMFPAQESMIARKGDHGRADAMLIAAYGATRLGGLL